MPALFDKRLASKSPFAIQGLKRRLCLAPPFTSLNFKTPVSEAPAFGAAMSAASSLSRGMPPKPYSRSPSVGIESPSVSSRWPGMDAADVILRLNDGFWLSVINSFL
jgi:hypothetical protein